MLLVYVVEAAVDATLQQREVALGGIAVDIAAGVLAIRVAHTVMALVIPRDDTIGPTPIGHQPSGLIDNVIHRGLQVVLGNAIDAAWSRRSPRLAGLTGVGSEERVTLMHH